MFCTNCGNKLEQGVKFCGNCGERVVSLEQNSCIDGHSWAGCKCTRCGEVRDMEHKFQLLDGKCEIYCPVCEESRSVEHQWVDDKCTHCGATNNSVKKVRKGLDAVKGAIKIKDAVDIIDSLF